MAAFHHCLVVDFLEPEGKHGVVHGKQSSGAFCDVFEPAKNGNDRRIRVVGVQIIHLRHGGNAMGIKTHQCGSHGNHAISLQSNAW